MELKSSIPVSVAAANLLQSMQTCGAISVEKIPSSLVTSAVKCLKRQDVLIWFGWPFIIASNKQP